MKVGSLDGDTFAYPLGAAISSFQPSAPLGRIYPGVTFDHVLIVFDQDTFAFTFYLSIALLIADVLIGLSYLMSDYLEK